MPIDSGGTYVHAGLSLRLSRVSGNYGSCQPDASRIAVWAFRERYCRECNIANNINMRVILCTRKKLFSHRFKLNSIDKKICFFFNVTKRAIPHKITYKTWNYIRRMNYTHSLHIVNTWITSCKLFRGILPRSRIKSVRSIPERQMLRNTRMRKSFMGVLHSAIIFTSASPLMDRNI